MHLLGYQISQYANEIDLAWIKFHQKGKNKNTLLQDNNLIIIIFTEKYYLSCIEKSIVQNIFPTRILTMFVSKSINQMNVQNLL